ncbi:MAG: xanthine dehydrogenase family protein subunit M [bacterium]
MIRDFTYIRPKSIEEACSLLRKGNGDAVLNAGGTDLLDLMKAGIATPRQVIDLKSFPELKRIDYRPGVGLTLGALTTIREIAANTIIREKFTALSQAAMRTASPQLRNLGTIGGNLCQRPRCWYFRGDFHCLRKGGQTCFAVMGENSQHCIIGGDPCYIVHPSDPAVALLALNATVTIQSGRKTRSVPLQEFYLLPRQNVEAETILQPGEMVTEVFVPDPSAGTVSGYLKFSERQSWDFALVSVAAVLRKSGRNRVESGRVALGGVAPVPWLENTVTSRLTAVELDGETAQRFASEALQDVNPLEKNEYKVVLAKNLIADLLTRLAT